MSPATGADATNPMSDRPRIVLDGTLFAECELYGKNRDGMTRLAESITDGLVSGGRLDIRFASTLYIERYDRALKSFVRRHYPSHEAGLLTRNPPRVSNVLYWRQLFRTKLARLPISSRYREIDSADLFHSFYYPFPASIAGAKVKKSLTFLDIIPLVLPGYPASLVERTRAIVRSIEPNFAISISEFSRQDLLEFDRNIKPEQVFVVPLAASSELFFPNTDAAQWQRVKAKYGLPEDFFLTVSSSDRRKNIPHVVRSFAKFLQQQKPADLVLVLMGNAAHSRSMLDELNLPQDVKQRIVMPDRFVDSEDLSVIYSRAHSFFFMSLYEGFGLPVLEAMQCGTPVVTSSATSLPEVAGDAALILDPQDEDALAAAMDRLYGDSSLRQGLAAAGLRRAAGFSWQRCADEYAEIFRAIASS